MARELADASGLSDAQRQDAGRHRIQGSQMTDLAGLQQLSDALHDVVRRHAAGLVDDEDAVQSGP